MSEDREYTINHEILFQMISTAFDDGTHFARQSYKNGVVTDQDVRIEADKYARDFVNHGWWKDR